MCLLCRWCEGSRFGNVCRIWFRQSITPGGFLLPAFRWYQSHLWTSSCSALPPPPPLTLSLALSVFGTLISDSILLQSCKLARQKKLCQKYRKLTRRYFWKVARLASSEVKWKSYGNLPFFNHKGKTWEAYLSKFIFGQTLFIRRLFTRCPI